MVFHNRLSEAEAERLFLLSEELGEAVQAIGKILRHGYESKDPTIAGGPTNREALEKEIADIFVATGLLLVAGDISRARCARHEDEKAESVKKYLHHQ